MKALIIIDMQNDFMPGGPLGVKDADTIIPVINRLMPSFDLVVASQDYHPRHHVSFASTHHKHVGEVITVQGHKQQLWPDHCVQGTNGVKLDSRIDKDHIKFFIKKGEDLKVDSYSCFFDNGQKHTTGLQEFFLARGYNQLYFAGVATDFCVKYSVLDSLSLGFETFVISDACKAVFNHEKAISEMKEAGSKVVEADSFLLNR